jgi:hypothetical protein
MAVLVLALGAYCMVKAPSFHALASGARGWLQPLASGSALEIDAIVCEAIVFLGLAVSLFGAWTGALALTLDHGEVDRRSLGVAGIVAGLLVPILAMLALRWAWAFVVQAHVGGT